jgi:hypothetical protein
MRFTMYVQACLLQDFVAKLLTHIVKLNDLVGFVIALVAAIVSTRGIISQHHILIPSGRREDGSAQGTYVWLATNPAARRVLQWRPAIRSGHQRLFAIY